MLYRDGRDGHHNDVKDQGPRTSNPVPDGLDGLYDCYDVRPRASNPEMGQRYDGSKEDRKFGNHAVTGITVNGVSLMEIQKRKNQLQRKTTPDRKRKTSYKRKKEPPPVPSSDKQSDIL